MLHFFINDSGFIYLSREGTKGILKGYQFPVVLPDKTWIFLLDLNLQNAANVVFKWWKKEIKIIIEVQILLKSNSLSC